MNILHIISGGEVGGSKTHLLALAKAFKDKGEKCILLCFIKGKLYEEAIASGLDIRLVEQKKRFDLKIVKKIAEICFEEKIDVINCHGARANFIGTFLKREYKALYATTVHSDYKDDYRGNKYKTVLYSNLNKFSLKSFDLYLTVSDNFKEMLAIRGFDPEKIKVIYNGIDFNKAKGYESREVIIEELGIRKTENYVLMLARFHPVKGHEVFLKACKEVLQKEQDIVFILLGDGESKDNILKLAEELEILDYLHMPGFINPHKYLLLCDFTVLTSYTESFPLAILESAAYKKTVISTEVGGINKLVEDNVNGFLIEPGDYMKLADRMLELISDKKKTVEFGEKLYNKASMNFSVDNMMKGYIEAYELMLSGGKNND